MRACWRCGARRGTGAAVSGAATATPGRRAVLVFYVSGHAFGHASRVIEIINAILTIDPGVEIVVRTGAAKWLFDVTVRGPIEFHELQCDTGVIQRDSLHLDIPATIAAAWDFTSRLDELAAAESAFLRGRGATLVVGDMPPLAFAAAEQAGLPAVALGNFTWDWIYAAYREELAAAPDLVPAIRRAYGLASLTLRLPLWGGFRQWASPIVDLPFVARHSGRSPEEVRQKIGVPPGTRVVLASFGGLGISGLSLEPLGRLDGYTVVTTGHGLERIGDVPEGVRLLEDRDVYARGLRYEDLVRAADVVVTKPGYGIIAECLANETAMLYTSRGRFAEYDVLVAGMPRILRCRFLGHDDLFAGHWRSHLDAVLAQSPPPEHPRTDGALVAARRLLCF
jgi:L-arabinokinase